jgi:hypothetical protein
MIKVKTDEQEPQNEITVETNITIIQDVDTAKNADVDAAEVKSDHIELDAVNLDQSPKISSKEGTEEGFCCVMSLFDGVVLYTTPTITSTLGFPREMWLGRSFVDFLHPKDRFVIKQKCVKIDFLHFFFLTFTFQTIEQHSQVKLHQV